MRMSSFVNWKKGEMMKTTWIDGKELYGLAYDWRLIEREYKKLGVPSEFYAPPFAQLPYNKYFYGLSDRSTGKTTTWILVGMVMYKLYGTVIQYVRSTADELKPSDAQNLTSVISEYNAGQYIERATDGAYNSIFYRWKDFFFCRVDESGNRVSVSEKPFMHFLSIDHAAVYKSSYNAPRGDLILWDEFISRGRYYRPNEFVDFMDLTKTIIRERQSAIIVMLGNTISLSSPAYDEMEISKEMRTLKKGDRKQIITDGGTHIYVELIDAEVSKSKARQAVNRLYYGFKNPKMAAITGNGLYAFDAVPHIPPRDESFYMIENRIYISTGVELLRCDYCYNGTLGYHFQIHHATRFYDDSVILTLDTIRDDRFVWGFGTARLKDVWNRMLIEHRVYYESNEVGHIFKDYLSRYKALK